MVVRVEVIYWRDIPAQVTAKLGRHVHRVALAGRFQEAIDRAATRAGMIGTDDYLGEWHKQRNDASGDPAEIARRTAIALEDSFPDDVLDAYVANQAWQP